MLHRKPSFADLVLVLVLVFIPLQGWSSLQLLAGEALKESDWRPQI